VTITGSNTTNFGFQKLGSNDDAGYSTINEVVDGIDTILNTSDRLIKASQTPTASYVITGDGTDWIRGLVVTNSITDLAVTTGKIAESAVTTGKIAESAVTSSKIATDVALSGNPTTTTQTAGNNTTRIATTGFVTTAISNAATSGGQIATGGIADNAVTESKIATGAITSAKILDGTIVAGDISSTYPGHQVVTTTQKNALTGVTTGTMVYDSTLGVMQVWNGTIWTFPTKRVGVKVYRTSSQAMTSEVSWNTAEWDTDPAGAMWSAASPSLITVKTAGLYNVTFSGSWQRTGGSPTYTLFYINQNYNTVRSMNVPVPAVSEGFWTITAQLSAAVNDTFMFSGAVVGGTGVTYGGGATETQYRTTAVLTLIGT